MSGGEIAILKAKLADCHKHLDLLQADKMTEVRARIDAQNQFFTATARVRDLEGAFQEHLALVQELYDASTVLLAALTFTHCTEDLVKPELDDAIKRLIYARNTLRRTQLVEHREAALVPSEVISA